jgi:hypothetical protein
MQKGGQAIVGGWDEPYYLGSPGLMLAGPVVVYTTKYEGELESVISLSLNSTVSHVMQ